MGGSRSALALGLACLLAACASAPADDARADGPLGRAFAESARETGVPRDLLVAIAIAEDGLQVPALRDALHETSVPAAGPLMLRHGKLDTLARGALLVGAREDDLRRDADLALRAGARVLAELGPRTNDLAAWEGAIGELSGFADDAHREAYVHKVYATLARGGVFLGRDGEAIALPAHDVPPALALDLDEHLHALSGSAQYPGAEWIPTSCTNKCDPGRDGAKVEYLVVHDTEGGWAASVATLQNDPKKSVQYIVGTDGRIGQFVTEETTAWHAGNYFYNQHSIGVEHVGWATQAYPEAQYAASAKLFDHLAAKYGIPRDRAHIVGHDQIPNGSKISQNAAPCAKTPSSCEHDSSYGGASNHDDPGVWEWPTFMDRIGGQAKCTDAPAVLTCSHDKTRAFRCVAGKVEVDACEGGCVPAAGADAKCTIAPKSSPETSGVAPQPGDGPPALTPVSAPLVVDPPSEDVAGCAVATRPMRADRSGGAFAIVIALGLVASRLRSRR